MGWKKSAILVLRAESFLGKSLKTVTLSSCHGKSGQFWVFGKIPAVTTSLQRLQRLLSAFTFSASGQMEKTNSHCFYLECKIMSGFTNLQNFWFENTTCSEKMQFNFNDIKPITLGMWLQNSNTLCGIQIWATGVELPELEEKICEIWNFSNTKYKIFSKYASNFKSVRLSPMNLKFEENKKFRKIA